MKQVVTEVWRNDVCDILISYKYDSELIGKKEREEVVTETPNGKIVKYWVRVANDPVVAYVKPKESSYERSYKKALEKTRKHNEKRKKVIHSLYRDLKVRVQKYREQILAGQEICPDIADIESARELQSMKKVGKNFKDLLEATT